MGIPIHLILLLPGNAWLGSGSLLLCPINEGRIESYKAFTEKASQLRRQGADTINEETETQAGKVTCSRSQLISDGSRMQI